LRPVPDGRLRGVLPPAVGGPRLLVGPPACADRGWFPRRGAGADHAEAPLPSRSPLRAPPDLWTRPHHPRTLPQRVRILRASVRHAGAARGGAEPGLHVPAELPGLGHRLLARDVSGHVVRDRTNPPRAFPTA